ncbi:MAG: NAD(P)/FAD-dependent oxidoreductase [Tenericutes bacterium]|nr:NAD(P)/FAD-dependent oxidoreductase [Mycoplasmatota bacterium]
MRVDIVVVGGGAAGVSAANSAYEKNLKVLLIERDKELGGILNQCIHNGFGIQMYNEELTGPEYARRSEKSLNSEIKILLDTCVLSIKKGKDEFIIKTSSEQDGLLEIVSKAVIISTGSYERTRGQIKLPGKRLKGIMTAGSAQRYINKEGFLVGKRILILGSGDIGLIMARRLSLEGSKVEGVIELMSYSNGLTRNIVSCLDDFNIPLYLSHTVSNIKGKDKLEEVEIMQVDEHFNFIENTKISFEVDTLLLSVGLIPDVSFVENLDLTYDKNTKSAKVNQNYMSNIDGLFFCGNALHIHDVVDWVTIEASFAGEYAKNYVKGLINKSRDEHSIIKSELISYTVPQIIDFNNLHDSIHISFRSKVKASMISLKLYQDGQCIKKKNSKFVTPSEMEKITVDTKSFISENDVFLEMVILE